MSFVRRCRALLMRMPLPMRMPLLMPLLMLLVMLPQTVCATPAAVIADDGGSAQWRERFAREVDRRLDLPPDQQLRYVGLLEAALSAAGLPDLRAQAVLLVDRSVHVQAAFLIVRRGEQGWTWLGASPVSTGRVGSFDHFETPLGVFAHSLDNPDSGPKGPSTATASAGTACAACVSTTSAGPRRCAAGERVDSTMRLQMHATDPLTLEPRLGRAESKGCIGFPPR